MKERYSVNGSVFDAIGPDAAYWIGFIYADGYLSRRHHSLVLVLQEKDLRQLEAFRVFMGTNNPIFTRLYSGQSPRVELTIRSKRIYERLLEIGAHQKTSRDLAFPECIPPEHQRDFIRGYFDGDGTITSNGKRQPGPSRIAFTSCSRDILESIREIVAMACGLRQTKIYHRKEKDSYSLSWGGRCQVSRIAGYLRRPGEYCLNRKLGELQ